MAYRATTGSGTPGLFGTIVLAGAVVGFAALTELPWVVAICVSAVGVGGSIALRRWGQGRAADLSAAPVLIGTAVLATSAPPTPFAALLAGAVGVAVLAWMADDPARAAGALTRARPAFAVVALSLLFVWGVALLTARASADVGVAGALLAVSLFLMVVILGRPQLLDPHRDGGTAR